MFRLVQNYKELGLGAIAGVIGSALIFTALASPTTANDIAVSDLGADFAKPIGLDGPFTGKWKRLHDVNGLTVWADVESEIIAVTRDDRAVLLFSDMEDIRYLDLFNDGEPRVTVEIAPGDERMFLYDDAENGGHQILIDTGIDGTIDKTITKGTAEIAADNS